MANRRLSESLTDQPPRFVTHLSAEDAAITRALATHMGLRSRGDLVRMALRALYRETFGHSWAAGVAPEAQTAKASDAA